MSFFFFQPREGRPFNLPSGFRPRVMPGSKASTQEVYAIAKSVGGRGDPIKEHHTLHGYLLDPHSAVGVCAAGKRAHRTAETATTLACRSGGDDFGCESEDSPKKAPSAKRSSESPPWWQATSPERMR